MANWLLLKQRLLAMQQACLEAGVKDAKSKARLNGGALRAPKSAVRLLGMLELLAAVEAMRHLACSPH